LRLTLAHMIVGAPLLRAQVEPQRALTDAVGESVETCASETAFDTRRREVLALLRFDGEAPTVIGGYGEDDGIAGLFVRLLGLSDDAVLEVLALVMAEALEAGTALIEVLGPRLGIDMTALWQPDDALLDLIRDREVLAAILTDVAGEGVASANDGATGKVKRQIIRDCLTGENGRAKVEGWLPRWMAFPPAAYTTRGGVQTVDRSEALGDLIAAITQQVPTIVRAA
jgi:ParB family chromosome partitioning protein